MEQQRIFPSGSAGGRGIKPDDLIAAFRTFTPSKSEIRGDHDLNDFGVPDKLRSAAVLVPVVCHDGELTMLLTKRTAHLYHHPGQISFPGGHVDAVDESPEACALRETEEEVGIPPENIEIIGRLTSYVTRTGFHVVPIVALIDSGYPLDPDDHEVAEVFEVPLSFLLDRTNHRKCSKVFLGKQRYFWSMPYGDFFIWGATAGMIRNFCDIVKPL